MNSSIVIPMVIQRVKEIHTEQRWGGGPYWEHPLRCHAHLVEKWPSVPLEIQVAMLFHDTLEDVHSGEHVLIHCLVKLREHCATLDGTRIWHLVRDVTNLEGVSRKEVIDEVQARFREGRVRPEAYLLKAFDMCDNTTDLLAICRSSLDLPGGLKDKVQESAKKYSSYLDAIEYGWDEHAIAGAITTDVDLVQVMDQVTGTVRRSIESIAALVDA